jgi:hypothetical protein
MLRGYWKCDGARFIGWISWWICGTDHVEPPLADTSGHLSIKDTNLFQFNWTSVIGTPQSLWGVLIRGSTVHDKVLKMLHSKNWSAKIATCYPLKTEVQKVLLLARKCTNGDSTLEDKVSIEKSSTFCTSVFRV